MNIPVHNLFNMFLSMITPKFYCLFHVIGIDGCFYNLHFIFVSQKWVENEMKTGQWL